jgi:hypothetical protein
MTLVNLYTQADCLHCDICNRHVDNYVGWSGRSLSSGFCNACVRSVRGIPRDHLRVAVNSVDRTLQYLIIQWASR